MNRNLDVATLRSLVAIDDTGGVTRAANRLHMTQSAVSMQIRRLEDSLDIKVIERDGRHVRLTTEGERLVEAARQMLPINDDIVQRLTTPRYEGSLLLGVPHDLIYPHLPHVLRRFAKEYPNVSVKFTTELTVMLKRGLREGRYDVVLGTEARPSRGGTVLAEQQLVWSGAIDGRAWRQRPLPVSVGRHCMFRKPGLKALKAAGIPYEEVVDSDLEDAIKMSVAADHAISIELSGADIQGAAPIDHGGELPPLGGYCITSYTNKGDSQELAEIFVTMVAERYQAM